MKRPSEIVLATALAGCTRSPSVSVLGAYFPDWIFCITGSVLLAIAVHRALKQSGHEAWMYPLAVTSPALVMLLSLIGWLIFFRQ